MTDLSANAKKAIQMGVDNPQILQQVNQRSQPDRTMQDASMMQGRGRRGMDFAFNATAPNKTALMAGLTLGLSGLPAQVSVVRCN